MKKLNKFFAVLVALAMMAMLSVTAFATESPYATDPDKAKLVKYLQAGTGVDLPAATYNFQFSPVAGNPSAIDEFTTTMTFAAKDKDANGDYITSKTIEEIFSGKTFAKPGEYKFTVTELAPTYTAGDNESLTKDNDTFTLHLYVKNSGTGTAIDSVTVQQGADGEKVDPTIIKDVADEGQDKDGNNEGFSFTNIYKKNLVDPDKDNPESQDSTGVLDVSKTVTGDYGDKTYDFPFVLTYTKPAANQDGAVKYKKIPKGATAAEIAAITPTENTTGTISFTLKDGEKLIITEAPQGTTWSTVENLTSCTDLQNYNKYTAKANGVAATQGQNASTADAVLTAIGTQAAYENALEDTDVTPTGILISNLPYIALALVAIGGLVAYVVVRRRQDNEA